MSQRLPEVRDREEFSDAIRRAAWARCGGFCEGCNRSLEGVAYVYDHTVPWRRGGQSTLANCKVLCSDSRDSCNGRKTYGEDIPGIAAVKRYGKNRLPLDVDRPVKQPPKIKTRKANWPQGRKMQNRPFPAKRSL